MKNRLVELGIEIDSDELLNSTFERFKVLADKKSEIYDEDIQALVTEEFVSGAVDRFKLVSLKSFTDTQKKPYADIEISVDGELNQAKAEGGGPVDATFKAIENIVESNTELLLYSVNNITSGTDSNGQVTVRLAKGGRIVNELGSDTDIVIASAMAYLNALNKLVSKSERAHPQV